MRERPTNEYETALRSVLIMLTNATLDGGANRTFIQRKLHEARAYYDSQGRTSASATIHSVLAGSGLLDQPRAS